MLHFLLWQSSTHSFLTIRPPADFTWLYFGVLAKAQLERQKEYGKRTQDRRTERVNVYIHGDPRVDVHVKPKMCDHAGCTQRKWSA